MAAQITNLRAVYHRPLRRPRIFMAPELRHAHRSPLANIVNTANELSHVINPNNSLDWNKRKLNEHMGIVYT